MSFAEASERSHWGPRCCNWREHVQSLASHAESKLRPAPRTHASRYVSYAQSSFHFKLATRHCALSFLRLSPAALLSYTSKRR